MRFKSFQSIPNGCVRAGYGNPTDIRRHGHACASLILRSVVNQGPHGAFWQINLAFPGILINNRRNKHIRAEHILILQLPACLILREFIKHGPDYRASFLMRFFHQFTGVRPHPFPETDILFQNRRVVVTETPDLVVRPCGHGGRTVAMG